MSQPHPAGRANSPGTVLFASLIGTTIEFFDFYIYATAAVLVFPTLFFPAGLDPVECHLELQFAVARDHYLRLGRHMARRPEFKGHRTGRPPLDRERHRVLHRMNFESPYVEMPKRLTVRLAKGRNIADK